MDLRHFPAKGRPNALSLARPMARQSALIALLAVLFASVLALVPTRADAYPTKPSPCTCSVSAQFVTSGTVIKFHGEAEVPLHWKVTFDGKVKRHTGNSFDVRYTAPNLNGQGGQGPRGADGSRVYNLVVDSAFVDPSDASAFDAPCREVFEITVSPRKGEGALPDTGDENGALPNTGGPQLALLGVALMLLLLGVASIRRARRTTEA